MLHAKGRPRCAQSCPEVSERFPSDTASATARGARCDITSRLARLPRRAQRQAVSRRCATMPACGWKARAPRLFTIQARSPPKRRRTRSAANSGMQRMAASQTSAERSPRRGRCNGDTGARGRYSRFTPAVPVACLNVGVLVLEVCAGSSRHTMSCSVLFRWRRLLRIRWQERRGGGERCGRYPQ